jgi:hypothetical protein
MIMAGLDNAGLVIESAVEADNAADRAAITSRCFDTIATPAVGQVISGTLESYVMATRNASLLFVDYESGALSFFRLLLTSYDPETFEFEGRCTEAQGTAESSGWFVRLVPGPVSGAAQSPASITFFDDATAVCASAPYEITMPASIEAGDLIVVSVMRTIGTAHTLRTPDGFTRFGDPNYIFLYVKIADGSEGGATIEWEHVSGSGAVAFAAQVFRGDVPIASFDIGSMLMDTTDPLSITVTSSTGAAPLIVFGSAQRQTGAPSHIDFSPSEDGIATIADVPSEAGIELAYKIYDTSPADVTITANALGTFAVKGFYISLYVPPAEPGDIPVLEDDGSGNAVYPEADGSHITNIQPQVTTATFSTASTVGFALPTKPNGTLYKYYDLDAYLITSADNVAIYFRTDANGGASVDAGASDYGWAYAFQGGTGPFTTNGTNDTADNQIVMVDTVGNAAGEFGQIKAVISNAKESGRQTLVTFENTRVNGSGALARVVGAGRRLANQVDNYIQFLPASGTITGEYSVRAHD